MNDTPGMSESTKSTHGEIIKSREDLVAAMALQQERIAELQEQVKTAENDADEQEAINVKHTAKVKALEEDNQDLQKRIICLADTGVGLEKQVSELTAEIKYLHQTLRSPGRG